jgi:hypothetical protein
LRATGCKAGGVREMRARGDDLLALRERGRGDVLEKLRSSPCNRVEFGEITFTRAEEASALNVNGPGDKSGKKKPTVSSGRSPLPRAICSVKFP